MFFVSMLKFALGLAEDCQGPIGITMIVSNIDNVVLFCIVSVQKSTILPGSTTKYAILIW